MVVVLVVIVLVVVLVGEMANNTSCLVTNHQLVMLVNEGFRVSLI